MKNRRWIARSVALKSILLMLALIAATAVQAGRFTLNVVDQNGSPVSGFRWLLQEDATFPVDPNNPATNPDDLLSLSFHTSYHPLARKGNTGAGQSGNTDGSSVLITNVPFSAPARRYYVSVLPYSGYSISGAPVLITQSGAVGGPDGESPAVNIVVQEHPLPTAQISVFLFQDNFPINGAPDLPEEANPEPGDPGHLDWTQFNIIVEEPAGRFGIAGGQVIQDAFGNPLGTTYSDTNGTVATLGDGTLHPDANGFLTIKNLAPGKYGIIAIPPTGSGLQQTATIEGTKVIDAWVKANEPPFFVEFGPPGPHVFIGFIDPGSFPLLPGGGTTVSGTVTDMHVSRPPNFQFFSGRPFPGCWVGLNDNTVGLGAGLFAAPCDGESGFSIPSVPPGNYQLKVFDANLDIVIATLGFTVDQDGNCDVGVPPSCNFGDVPVFNWFARLNTGVFNDENQDGFWDTGEIGIGPESQDVTLRWRDGSVYQNFPTDNGGLAPFDEVFPFFHWLVAEVSFANKKATGATFVVDAGGEIPSTSVGEFPDFGELNPQPQSENDGLPYRTELGPVLTTGFQGFLGQTSVMHFGKTDYVTFDFSNFPPTFVGENGGISGIVYYATTRAESEPQFAAAEEWEPGIPRVQVSLYADGDINTFPLDDFPDGVGDIDWNGDSVQDGDDNVPDSLDGIDDDGDGNIYDLADVDNHPLGWADPGCVNSPAIPGNECIRGPEDIDRDDPAQTLVADADAVFEFGDALQVTWTDSWDDNLPTGCQGANNLIGVADNRCFDGLRNFNQIRPGVFDGGYAFADYDLDHLGSVHPVAAAAIQNYYSTIETAVGPIIADTLQLGLLPADYIVEAATPPGYEELREEHKNVDFGDVFEPSPQALAANCVGDLREVPQFLSIATKDGSGDPAQVIPAFDSADAHAPFALEMRPLCDRKKLPLSAGQNAAADFFMMTDVPTVANVSGITLNDLANEFDPNSPTFGEKFAPPWLPIAFYDWNGKLVNRIYADQFGRYNAVLPSTYTANLPQPSGMSPNMLISCMNDAGPIPDGNGGLIIDPFFDSQYSQFCYTFQYMPGVITYLDTPVVPIAAFAGRQFPVDCERPTMTPMIASVTRTDNTGPFVVAGADQRIRVRSMGNNVTVPNPEWDGVNPSQKTIQRDYRFTSGNKEVFLEAADGTRFELDGNGNNRNVLTRIVQDDVPPGDYQVVVVTTSGNYAGTETPIGLTLTVGTAADTGLRPNGNPYAVHRVAGPAPYPATPIQDAIDAAAPGDLILVPPGSYDELVIMWKPVKLQGWGAGAVIINARQVPTEKVAAWRAKAEGLVAAGSIDPLPGQVLEPFGFPALAEVVFPTEEGAGIFVAGKQTGPTRFGRFANRHARIDGFTIVGASTGGGIVVNGYAQYLRITNNRLTTNAGFYGGGIRVGHPQLSHETAGGDLVYDDAINDRIRIRYNHIVKNGGQGGAGGGLSLHTGADAYRVQNNWICGNFSQGDGGGIGHMGRSNGGLIEDNHVIFNESFNQGLPKSGGGIFIGGLPGLMPESETGLVLTPGTGTVTVDANLIRGNLAGAGDGGGIRLANVNGQDVAASLDDRGPWYRVSLFNNMIDNNVAGLAGGGISIEEALKVSIRNNTVANNDSTSTTALAFEPNSPNETVPLPAGIVSRVHNSASDFFALMNLEVDSEEALPGGENSDWLRFSDPVMRDDIIYHNRSFFWSNFDDPATPTTETGLFPATCENPPGGAGCDVAGTNVDDYSNDLAVLDGRVVSTDLLNPRVSLLLDGTTPYHGSNTFITGDPGFVNGYFNGSRDSLLFPEFTVLQTALAFDEGGNFIQVTYGPLSLLDPGAADNTTLFDYHLGEGSPAINQGGNTPETGRLSVDFDNEPRPEEAGESDIGADENEM